MFAIYQYSIVVYESNIETLLQKKSRKNLKFCILQEKKSTEIDENKAIDDAIKLRLIS